MSSLKTLDKKVLNEKFKEFGVDSISELRDYIIDNFEMCLEMSTTDLATRKYFEQLVNHQDSELMCVQQQDIENLMVFVYDNGKNYSYYIPTEIKEIIDKLLKI